MQQLTHQNTELQDLASKADKEKAKLKKAEEEKETEWLIKEEA